LALRGEVEVLKLKLFGSGEASYYDQQLEGFPYQQAFMLFCYLLLNKGKPSYRERLAAVFWGDYPNLTARKYLRNTLYRLRLGLDSIGANSSQYLLITEENVSFISSSAYWLDVECFETISSHYRTHKPETLLPEQANELKDCLDLYTGDLLEGVYDDWCLNDRERLRLSYLDVLGKLMAYSTVHADFEPGLEFGARILALDPTREVVHRQMMLLHWLSGDRHSALAQYKRCAQILEDEMGIQPMEETRTLYTRMLHNQFEFRGMPVRSEQNLVSSAAALSTTSDFDSIVHSLNKLKEEAAQITTEIAHLQRLIDQIVSKDKS
jgi:DNA-binding SARP family transcriptional activator